MKPAVDLRYTLQLMKATDEIKIRVYYRYAQQYAIL